jgi:Lhr-like helicase
VGPKDSLLELARRAAPFQDLSREDFEDVTELLAEGIRPGAGGGRITCTATRSTGRSRAAAAPGWPR